MARRIHIAQLHPGTLPLPADQAHHVRDVLRMNRGDAIELFDTVGQFAAGTIESVSPSQVIVIVGLVQPAPAQAIALTIASAIPKGNRADWMIEKLSELGAGRFVPLITARSVVTAKGIGKLDRWARIAAESARQSRGSGVMQIDPPVKLSDLLARSDHARGWFFEPPASRSMESALADLRQSRPPQLTLFIGPEGGWTNDELVQMRESGLTAVRLTETILRIETAAISAAAIVMTLLHPAQKGDS